MRKALTDQILAECSNVTYHGRRAGIRICFECGDGWFNILLDLMRELNALENVHVQAVKEKFGILRVYATGPDEVSKAVRKAEGRSCVICEQCGDSGQLVSNHGWLRVTCVAHGKPGDEPANLEFNEVEET